MDGRAVLPGTARAVELRGPSTARPPRRAVRPVGITQPSSPTRLRRKFAASSWTPQTASYTARSSAIVKVVPTKAVAMPETSSPTRTLHCVADDSQVVERELGALLEDVRGGDEGGVRCVGAGDDAPVRLAGRRGTRP